VRARAASAIGHLTAALAIEKGLPHSYGRDLQQAQEHLFSLHDDLIGSLAALAGLVAGSRFQPPPPPAAVTAPDLAEALVQRGVAFREAHEAVGHLVAALEAEGRDLGQLTAADLAAAHSGFEPADVALTDPVASVRARSSPGGGSFASVGQQLASLEGILGELGITGRPD
jgi:argininosuccinate lyase